MFPTLTCTFQTQIINKKAPKKKKVKIDAWVEKDKKRWWRKNAPKLHGYAMSRNIIKFRQGLIGTSLMPIL